MTIIDSIGTEDSYARIERLEGVGMTEEFKEWLDGQPDLPGNNDEDLTDDVEPWEEADAPLTLREEKAALSALEKALSSESGIEFKKPVITPGGRAGNDASHNRSPKENWVDKRGGLPKYIRIVRNGLVREGHSEGRATALAVAAIKRWARGGDNVRPKVQAAAAKALAEWEAMKSTKSFLEELEIKAYDADRKQPKHSAGHKPSTMKNNLRNNKKPSSKKPQGRLGHTPNKQPLAQLGHTSNNSGSSRKPKQNNNAEFNSKHPRDQFGRFAAIQRGDGVNGKAGGEKDKQIRDVQRTLIGMGLLDKNSGRGGTSGIDGAFGPKTEAAIKKWQLKNGMKADGLLSKETISKLLSQRKSSAKSKSGSSSSKARKTRGSSSSSGKTSGSKKTRKSARKTTKSSTNSAAKAAAKKKASAEKAAARKKASAAKAAKRAAEVAARKKRQAANVSAAERRAAANEKRTREMQAEAAKKIKETFDRLNDMFKTTGQKALEEDMELKVVRHVRTPAGVARFKQPIGSVIIRKGLKLDGIKEIDSEYIGWNKYEGKDKKNYYVGKEKGKYIVTDPNDNDLSSHGNEEEALTWLNGHAGGSKIDKDDADTPKKGTGRFTPKDTKPDPKIAEAQSLAKKPNAKKTNADRRREEELAAERAASKKKPASSNTGEKFEDIGDLRGPGNIGHIEVIRTKPKVQPRFGTGETQEYVGVHKDGTRTGKHSRISEARGEIYKYDTAKGNAAKKKPDFVSTPEEAQAAKRKPEVGHYVTFNLPNRAGDKKGHIVKKNRDGTFDIEFMGGRNKRQKTRVQGVPESHITSTPSSFDRTPSKKSAWDGLNIHNKVNSATQLSMLNRVNNAVEKKDMGSAKLYAKMLLNDARANGIRDNGMADIQTFLDTSE